MIKMFLTLARGRAASAEEDFADRNALLLLDQQVRDAAAAIERAKRALALAIANDGREETRLVSLECQIADLEVRIVAALEAGNEPAAEEGAEAVAALEADRDATKTARALFTGEIARLKRHVAAAETRIAAVDRGRRIARAAEALRAMKRGRIEPALPHEATLREAETTLKRLCERQTEAQAAEDALDDLDPANRPVTVAEKLAEQGFGPRVKPTGADVLTRLRSKAVKNRVTETEGTVR